jgi:hypothetical protein
MFETRGAQTPPMHGFIADVRISSIARYTATFVPQRHLTANASTGTISGATWASVTCR